MSNPYFKKMKLKEKAYRPDGTCRVSEIAKDGKYTHAYLKYDGTHVDLEIKLPDSIRLLTREGNDVAHLVPYLIDDIRDHVVPLLGNDITIACEAVDVHMNPKKTWSHSRSVLGRKEYDASLGILNLMVYDIYGYIGYYYNRRGILDELFDHSIFCGLPCGYPINALEKTWNEWVEDKGYEGFVLFDEYMEDYRFTKLKPENVDIDCVVLAFHEGKKGTRLEGRLGAFEVGLYKPDGSLVSIGKVPTMTDEERTKWDERMNSSLGCCYGDGKMLLADKTYVIQVKASEVLPSGKLRFPSYVREREDKAPKECLWEQLGLE